MNLLSYDIEIYDELTDNNPDLINIRPSVAAICTNENDVQYFYDDPYMSVETAKKLVYTMMDYYENGYTIFGWNIVSFDLRLLAYYSGMIEECAELALNSIDGMLLVTFNRGHFLSLDAALIGANLETKTRHVFLNDGSEMLDMSGIKAPGLWKNKEFEAVKTYLKGDVIQPLKLAFAIESNNEIRWISKTGRKMSVCTTLTLVRCLFNLSHPNLSWITNPKPRSEFVNWIPKEILERNGVFL